MSDTQPTEKDLTYLKANPDKATKFDAQFGEGAAAAVLGQEPKKLPTQKDIEFLQSNPDKAAKFEEHFGAGTAANYLQPNPEVTAQVPATPPQDETFSLAVGDLLGLPEAPAGVPEATAQTTDPISPQQRILEGAVHGAQPEAGRLRKVSVRTFSSSSSQHNKQSGDPSGSSFDSRT